MCYVPNIHMTADSSTYVFIWWNVCRLEPCYCTSLWMVLMEGSTSCLLFLEKLDDNNKMLQKSWSFLPSSFCRAGTQRGSRQPLWERSVWTVERHVYKSYNVNLNLWIFTSDNDFHQMTEEEGEEGEMSISEALVSFSNFIHWPYFLCYFFFLFALNSGISS